MTLVPNTHSLPKHDGDLLDRVWDDDVDTDDETDSDDEDNSEKGNNNCWSPVSLPGCDRFVRAVSDMAAGGEYIPAGRTSLVKEFNDGDGDDDAAKLGSRAINLERYPLLACSRSLFEVVCS